MKTILFSAICGLMLGCTTKGDSRLSGTFVSDKAATMEHLRATGKYTLSQLETLSPIFGRLEVTYSGQYVTIKMDDYTDTSKFRVIDSDDKHLTIESSYRPTEYELPIISTNRLEFDGDGYWIMEADSIDSIREKFIRK